MKRRIKMQRTPSDAIEAENLNDSLNDNHVRHLPAKRAHTAKKIIIKNFDKPRLPENYIDETWSKLESAVIAVQESKSIDVPLEELYSIVENVCLHKMPHLLYGKLLTVCEKRISQLKRELIDCDPDDLSFLRSLDFAWQDHCRQIIMVRSIFLFLDRTYVLQNTSVDSIWDMGLSLFRTHIVNHPAIQSRTINSILNLIKIERNGDTVDRILLKNLLRMLFDLKVYQTVFETKFLSTTEEIYGQESQRYLEEKDIASYLRHCEKRLNDENDRLNHYLDHSTRRPLISVVEKQLVSNRMSQILTMGLDTLLEDDRVEILKLLYNLFSRVKNGLFELCKEFNSCVKITGSTIVKNPEKDKSMVVELLAFKQRMDRIVSQCFADDIKFGNSLKEAFENFINQRQNKPAELIAKFVDSKLRAGNKESTEEELEQLLDKVMVLFRFIHGKDVFEAFYKKDLAKRLLVGKSASIDAERSMLSKLKQECGAGFTAKLEGMFKDMELSKEIMQTYRSGSNTSGSGSGSTRFRSDIEFNASILTMGFWPTYQPVTCNVPSKLTSIMKNFQDFYLTKHSGKKLQWQHNLGQCLLKAHFDQSNATKELAVSFFQALVLMNFNSKDESNFECLKQTTLIESIELKRTLQSLACGKARVLNKLPKGRDVDEKDKFTFNGSFNNKLFRIKINQVQMRETEEENTHTQERVFQDRQCQIDAAIVRIMKTRKKLAHNILLTELFDMLKFPVKPADLKKRIESLIDREYIKRDEEDSNTYCYLA